jgi:hypothetical protein
MGIVDHGSQAGRYPAVLHAVIIKPLPVGAASNPGSNIKDKVVRRQCEMAILRQRIEFDWQV